MLERDLKSTWADLLYRFPWVETIPRSHQRALLNMAYNMGVPRLSKFRRMLMALKYGDSQGAAAEALNSLWASQVGSRAHDIADLYRGRGLTV